MSDIFTTSGNSNGAVRTVTSEARQCLHATRKQHANITWQSNISLFFANSSLLITQTYGRGSGQDVPGRHVSNSIERKKKKTQKNRYELRCQSGEFIQTTALSINFSRQNAQIVNLKKNNKKCLLKHASCSVSANCFLSVHSFAVKASKTRADLAFSALDCPSTFSSNF